MPKRTSSIRRSTRRTGKRMRGKGFISFLKKANNWLRSNKIVSKVAGALSSVGIPYADKVNSVATSLGYGRRRGGSLRLAGRGLGNSGSGRRRRR